jgi:DNA-binding NtrC family response regulator
MALTRTAGFVLDVLGTARALRLGAFRLKVVRGPDAKREKRFAATRVRVGSAPEADFALADRTVSALHCEIISDASGFRIRDLGAKNGVRLGERRVQEAWLEEKDELVLGESVVRFRALPEEEERALARDTSFGRLQGSSARMREVYAQLDAAAESDATVLLQGETGTGKELAAEALFTRGPRRQQPFVVVDCGRLPAGLAESELFGHEKGAFTGALQTHVGAFERAHGGTLFLDEVGDLPRDLQPKLLRALEQRTVRRVGGKDELTVNVRVIAATHRELEREINTGQFRADLFYRLAVVEIWLPALREHPEDIPELVAHFLQELPGPSELAPATIERLCQAEYPGNVRQLRNAVERAVLGLELPPRGPAVTAVDLRVPFRLQKERVISSFERAYVTQLLAASEGNVSEAARRSGMNRVHLHEVIQRLNLAVRNG